MKKKIFWGSLLLILIAAIVILVNKSIVYRYLSFKKNVLHHSWNSDNANTGKLKNNDASSINSLYLKVSAEDLEYINELRSSVVNKWIWTGKQNLKKHKYVTAGAKFKGYKSEGSLKMFGMYLDHYHEKQPSFRMKFKGKDFFAKRKMNFLSPKTRNYQLDFMMNKTFESVFEGIGISQEPVKLFLNNDYKGVYLIEDFFDKYLIEGNKRKESFIFETGYKGKFKFIPTYSFKSDNSKYSKLNTIPKGSSWKNRSKSILKLFQSKDNRALFNSIDREKFDALIGLCFLTQHPHALFDFNIHWYYNPVNHKLEPLIREMEITPVDKSYSLDENWEYFIGTMSHFKKGEKTNEFQIILDWIEFYGEESKNRIISSAMKSADHILDLAQSKEYLEFKSKLDLEYSFWTDELQNTVFSNCRHFLSFKDNFIKPLNELNLVKLELNKDTIFMNDFIVHENEILTIKEGVKINFERNANLYIYGSLVTNGKLENPVKFLSSSNSNSSIFIESKEDIVFNYCEFINLSALDESLELPLQSNLWETSGAITLYETSAVFSGCVFRSNLKGDDMLNVFRCKDISLDNCKFINIFSDALDSDFSTVSISNCSFEAIGNDAVDGSLSSIEIQDCNFSRVSDKAISAGEGSNFKLENCHIEDSEIAFVVKDASMLELNKISVSNNTLDFVAFRKKPEFEPPQFKISNFVFDRYLIEKSVLNLGEKTYFRLENFTVKSLLYSNKYGRATLKN